MERLRPVPRLVDALPQPFREAIVLHEIDDLSYSGNRPGDGGVSHVALACARAMLHAAELASR
jgi:hypothetical protein